MERLTEKRRNSDGSAVSKKSMVDENIQKHGISNYGVQMITKLADYEDAEEQGLLFRLPCKVGDKVYAFCDQIGILRYEVEKIVLSKDEISFQCASWSGYCNDDPSECLDEIEPDISDFGKTVFFTEKEAIAALKESEGD